MTTSGLYSATTGLTRAARSAPRPTCSLLRHHGINQLPQPCSHDRDAVQCCTMAPNNCHNLARRPTCSTLLAVNHGTYGGSSGYSHDRDAAHCWAIPPGRAVVVVLLPPLPRSVVVPAATRRPLPTPPSLPPAPAPPPRGLLKPTAAAVPPAVPRGVTVAAATAEKPPRGVAGPAAAKDSDSDATAGGRPGCRLGVVPVDAKSRCCRPLGRPDGVAALVLTLVPPGPRGDAVTGDPRATDFCCCCCCCCCSCCC